MVIRSKYALIDALFPSRIRRSSVLFLDATRELQRLQASEACDLGRLANVLSYVRVVNGLARLVDSQARLRIVAETALPPRAELLRSIRAGVNRRLRVA